MLKLVGANCTAMAEVLSFEALYMLEKIGDMFFC